MGGVGRSWSWSTAPTIACATSSCRSCDTKGPVPTAPQRPTCSPTRWTERSPGSPVLPDMCWWFLPAREPPKSALSNARLPRSGSYWGLAAGLSWLPRPPAWDCAVCRARRAQQARCPAHPRRGKVVAASSVRPLEQPHARSQKRAALPPFSGWTPQLCPPVLDRGAQSRREPAEASDQRPSQSPVTAMSPGRPKIGWR